MYAQLRQENGLYGEKVPIRREELSQSINYSQMATALQLGALQKQVESIAYQLVEIDCSVRAVLEGQQNDRMGLYYSGLSLYLEADACEDELFKKQALLQAIQTLAQASWQLRLTMEADIRFLANEAYKAHRGKSVQLIDERIQSIDQCFAVIHQASMLRAGIYCKIGEIGAMATTLKEYSGFIEGTVANNAMLLSQCDHRDKGTEDGIWQGRAALELDVAEIVKQLKNPEKTLYVGIAKENS